MVTGCSNYIEHGVDAGAPPSAFFSANPPNQCEGQPISFVAGPPGGLIVEEVWDFHDGSPLLDLLINTPQCCPANPTHTYLVSGPYHVTRTCNPGTASEATWDVFGVIYPNPGAEFRWFSDASNTWQGVACADQNVYFKDESFSNSTPPGNINTWLWDFGDPASGPLNNTSTLQNPWHVFSAPGVQYNVTLTVWDNLNNCESAPVQHPVVVNPAIATDFTYTDFTCMDQLVTFTPNPALVPTDYTWLWDFGDGSPVLNTPGSVSHLFPSAGTWVVTLSLTDQFGCSKSKSYSVTTIPLPIATFIFTAPTCTGNPIQFTDQSVSAANYPDLIVGWNWDFGDGTTSILQNPSHTYAVFNAAGYDVTLTVTTSRGCTATKTLHVQPIPGPKANFQIQPLTPACATQSVQFNDLSQQNGGGAIVSWLWNFGDAGSGSNNTAIAQNPTHTYLTAGPYDVILTVKNANGCTNTDTIQINVNDLPTADFIANTACAGSLTTFTNTTLPPNPAIITSFAWDFGDGGTSAQTNPQHTYATFGTYTVTLTVVNSNGCINVTQQQITVSAKPIPDFSYTPSGCLGDPVTYTDHSYIPGSFSGHIQTWQWKFGDGSVQPPISWPNSPNVSHIFQGIATTHLVWLIVTTTSGCVDSISHTVTSIPSPLANFAFSNTNCLGQLVTFTDLSSPNGGSSLQTWSWDFDDPLSGGNNTSTVQNPTHTFATAIIHKVVLKVTSVNGCTSTDTIPVNVHNLPVADFTYVNACEGDPTQFTDASSSPAGIPIISYSWNFGDASTSTAQNPPHAYSTAGLFNVTLTVVDSLGCVKTTSKPVIVNPKPVAEFSFTTSCVGSPVSFTDHSYVPPAAGSSTYIQTWQWDFGDGSTIPPISFPATPDITHTFSGIANNHVVRLTVTTTAGCTFFIEKTVSSISSPLANFSFSSTDCASQAVQFTDHTQTNGGGNINTWSWNFGDTPSGANNTSTIQNPTHSFTTAGSYQIVLTTTNVSGCSSTYIDTVNINEKPTANFTATSACQGSGTVFTDASTPTNIVSWSWNFGDGQTSTAFNPTHVYGISGIYSVQLTVTTSLGCTRDTIRQVEVFGKPLAGFSFNSPTCASDSVHFVNLSASPHGYVYKVVWSFGDGSPDVSRTFPSPFNVGHKYTNGGTYQVKLSLTTSDSCTAEKTMGVQVQFAPLADFYFGSTVCALMPLQFTDISQQNGGGGIASWSWDFGDPPSGANNTSTSQNPSHRYSSGLTNPRTVKLIVINANGCKDTISKPVIVNAAPIAKFAADTACISSSTSFTDQSTSSAGTITAWAWDFGDISSGANNTSTSQNPTHIYGTPGTYNVTLLVTNSNNCTRDTVVPVTVNAKPIALFKANASCVGDSTQFTDLSIAPGSSVVSWHWDFGDGTGTSTVQNPKYKYTTAGNYNVKLIVSNLSHCKDSVTIQVVARPKPVAAYNYVNFFCPAGQVSFQDMSTGTGAAITTHLWTFEPGATSGSVNPIHAFTTTNMNYAVSLVVTDNYGCQDTIVDSVFVKPAFSYTFTNDTVCFRDITHFHAKNLAQGDSLYNVSWDFGDPASVPNNTSPLYDPTHLFSAPGVYIVKLKAYDSDNCVDSIYHEVTVHALPAPSFTLLSTPSDSVIHFTEASLAGSGGISSWVWDFGDGSPALTLSAPAVTRGDTSHQYPVQGVYNVTLRINNSYGCTDTIKKQVELFPCIKAVFTNDTLLCARYPITFMDSSLPVARINQWHWIFGDGNDTTYSTYAGSIIHTFTNGGTYPVGLVITATVNGRTFLDTASQSIVIHPTPDPLFSNKGVCMHQPSIFMDTSTTHGEAVSAWTWTFGHLASGALDTAYIKNPTHTYDTAGYYNVQMVVKNQFGCKDSVMKPTRVYGLPVAKLNHEPACNGNPTLFHDLSTLADTTLHTWTWNFGDLTTKKDTSDIQEPSYTYKNEGSYDVKLIVKDFYGCKDTVDSTIVVHVTPVTAFTVTPGYNGMTGRLLLNNKTTGADNYVWNFGNGQTSSDENPVVTYADDGTYIIMLVSSNQYLCTDTTYYKYEFLFHGLYIPNAFSPTSGILGVSSFKAVGINLQQFRIEVYDSWGHQVWYSTELDADGRPTGSWDGRDKTGEIMQAGTYLWKVSATFIDGTAWKGSDIGTGNTGTIGTVTLIR